MSVRAANFSDIPEVVRLMREAHQASRYAETATFDADEATQLCREAMNRHGQHNYGAKLFLVSADGGHVQGYFIGFMDKIAPALKELAAVDLLFYFNEDANPLDAAMMIKEHAAWALAAPKCIEIHLGATDAIGDWQRVGKLYKRLGLDLCGGMWRRSIDRAPREKAANE